MKVGKYIMCGTTCNKD